MKEYIDLVLKKKSLAIFIGIVVVLILASWLGLQMSHRKPHKIVNKLQHAVRHSVLWYPKIIINKKKETKKRGVEYNDTQGYF